MNIITPLAAQPSAPGPDLAGNSAAPASDFGSVLQQAEAASPEAPGAAPASMTPAPVPTREGPSSALAELPAVAQPAEPAALPQAPALAVQPSTVQRPVLAEPASVEPAADAEPPATLAQAPATPQEPTDHDDSSDDSSTPARDSLEAIRQRLDLIDNAGVLAMSAAVAWTPVPVAAPEPVAEAEVGQPGPADASVEWPAADEQTLVPEPGQQLEQPATAMPASAPAPRPTSQDTSLDSPPGATADLPSPAADGTAALVTPPTLSLTSPAAAPLAAAPLGSPAWQADLGQQVVALVRRGDQQMDMQLNPADLGPLSISLNVSESGIQAQFQSAHAAVRTAVEQALPQLQAALASQGLSLGEASINDGASRQAMGEQPRRESPGSGAPASAEPTARATTEPPPAVLLASTGTGVDLYL